MTKIRLTKNAGGSKAGDSIEVSPGAAEYLTNAGFTTDSDTEPTVNLDGLDNYTDPDEPTDTKAAATSRRRLSKD
jgi:hypothetical protein